MSGGPRKGSGRKAFLEDKTREEILKLSAKTILEALQCEKLSFEFRSDLAAKIYVKSMPSTVDAELHHTFTEIGKITRGLIPLEARIG